MVADELTRALIEETTLEDISESYRPVVDIIGIEKFIELSEYAKGDELYFPKTENIIAPARNRRIKKEWNGYNSKELAEKYNPPLDEEGYHSKPKSDNPCHHIRERDNIIHRLLLSDELFCKLCDPFPSTH